MALTEVRARTQARQGVVDTCLARARGVSTVSQFSSRALVEPTKFSGAPWNALQPSARGTVTTRAAVGCLLLQLRFKPPPIPSVPHDFERTKEACANKWSWKLS